MEIIGYKDKHEYTNKNGVTSVVYLMDCMELLKQVPDKYFELAVVDPPYGIGAENHAGNVKNGWTQWIKKEWDSNIPSAEYFKELKEVSTNQIIWGANYMTEFINPSMGWIVWDKGQRDFSLADGELAWTSFNRALRIFTFARAKALQEVKLHPTQKPQQLYEWIFKNYAKPNDKILDTHLGSGSSRIAADKANLPFVGCELDPDYFYASVKRFKEYSAQQTIF